MMMKEGTVVFKFRTFGLIITFKNRRKQITKDIERRVKELNEALNTSLKRAKIFRINYL
jgi:hypothetical protein